MRHCVAIYAKDIAAGKCYCCQVFAPVRDTSEIERGPSVFPCPLFC